MKFIKRITLVLGIIFLCPNLAFSSETLTDYLEAETTIYLSDFPLYLKILAGNYSDREPEVFLTINEVPVKMENVQWLKWTTREKSRFRIVGSYVDTIRWDIASGISMRLGSVQQADYGIAFMADFPDFQHYSIEAQIWREFPVIFKNVAATFGCGYRWRMYPGICFSLGMSIGL